MNYDKMDMMYSAYETVRSELRELDKLDDGAFDLHLKKRITALESVATLLRSLADEEMRS